MASEVLLCCIDTTMKTIIVINIFLTAVYVGPYSSSSVVSWLEAHYKYRWHATGVNRTPRKANWLNNAAYKLSLHIYILSQIRASYGRSSCSRLPSSAAT